MKTWFLELKRWIKKLLKKKKKKQTTSTQIIERWRNKDCIVLQIERDTSGAITTYRANRLNAFSGGYDYLITLDYLPELQIDLGLETQLATEYKVPFRLRLRSNSQTHRFAVFRIWRNGSIHCIKAWDVDLEGLSASPSIQKRAPHQAVRYVVMSILDIFHDPNIPNSWQFQIEDIDWLFLLRNRIREELSNPQHNLHEVIVFPGVEIGTAR